MQQTQNNRSESLQKLQSLLQKLFRADVADLDFGIYRIINHRRDLIQSFIQEEIPSIIENALNANAEIESDREKLEDLRSQVINAFGADVLNADGDLIDATVKERPLVKEYLEAQEQIGSPQTSDQRSYNVFNHLYTFFSRYYDNGDFIPRRRYSQTERYAVPYNGEEVYLHWANRDQYYVKSGEHFSEYRVKVGSTTVIFDLKNVDIEKDNVKGVKRFFLPLSSETTYNAETDEVCIPFEYRPLNDAEKIVYKGQKQQDKIIETAEKEILTNLKNDYTIQSKLAQATDEVTLLKTHLQRYTRRNSADFFIHKDLKRFLARELDVYIKSEVIPMSSLIFDDVNFNDDDLKKVNWIETSKIFHHIAAQIIDFLAHIEEFQKRLWLKKKFVLSTDYCLTLDRVPEDFYPEIAENTAQLEEWKDLFTIHEIDKNLINTEYTEPLSVDFLKENPNLVLDTCHFDSIFKDRLLAHFDDLDGETEGLLIHGENFQGLNLLTEKYRESIKCIHIDPPYNTQTSGFLYKNSYQHSSWLSMMADRLTLSEHFMAQDSCFFSHIDESEYEKLFLFFKTLSMDDQGTVVWDKRNPIGASNTIATQHEYTICHSKGNVKLKSQHANGEMILRKASSLVKAHGGVTVQCRNEYKTWINTKRELSGMERSYSAIDENGHVYTTVHMGAGDVRTDPKYFRPLIHPITKKPCPVPKNGWSSTPEYIDDLLQNNEVSFGIDETTQPRRKCYLKDNLIGELTSVISTGERGKHQLDAFGLDFPYSHPVGLYEKLVWSVTPDGEGMTLDFFAGSGTNTHAVINLNRKDNGNRKYILIEMAHHFDTVLMPRVKKAVYAEKWKDSKPVSRDSCLSHIFKYQRIESYEDALNNIEFNESDNERVLLTDEHRLRYMLESETKESQTLLNISELQDPFSYKLKIVKDMQPQTQKVDLPETFNYLLGLSVQTRQCLQDGERRYLVYKGIVDQKTVVIIWRETAGWGQENYERDYQFIQEQELIVDIDEVYVNTCSNIPDAKSLDPIFKRLMFSE